MPTATKMNRGKKITLRTNAMPAANRQRVATRDFLVAVMKAYKEGKTCEDVADDLNMAKNSVYQKLNGYRKSGIKNLPHLPLNRSTADNINDPDKLQEMADALIQELGVELPEEDESEELDAPKKPRKGRPAKK